MCRSSRSHRAKCSCGGWPTSEPTSGTTCRLEGQQLHVIGEDGNPVWDVRAADDLVMPPGKRFDVLVVGPEAGEYTFETLKYEQGRRHLSRAALLTLTSNGEAVTTPALPTSMIPPAEIPRSRRS